jgi:hypothetical protein
MESASAKRFWPPVSSWTSAFALGAALLTVSPQEICTARTGNSRREAQRVIPPYDNTGAFSQGDLWSPDLRYIASARIGEGSILIVTVLDAHSHEPMAHLDDVDGFVWAPAHSHRLLAAACGEYGKAFLGMWEGGHAWLSLRRVNRPKYECFRLHGVTADGRYVVYGYEPNVNAPGGPREALLRRRVWLRLPARLR